MGTVTAIILTIVFICLFFTLWFCFSRISTDFAAEVLLSGGTSESIFVTDSEDINELKAILRGKTFLKPHNDEQGLSASLTFRNGKRIVSLRPLYESCTLLRINDTNRYIQIGEAKAKRLKEIMAKYRL